MSTALKTYYLISTYNTMSRPPPPQLRELRLEVAELQSSRVQEDVISRAESRVKELENTLRAEERSVT